MTRRSAALDCTSQIGLVTACTAITGQELQSAGIKSHAAHCFNVLARLRRGVADARLNLACAARPTCCSRPARFCVVRCLVRLHTLLYSCCFAPIAHRTNQSDSSKIVPGVTVIIQPLLHILIKALDIVR